MIERMGATLISYTFHPIFIPLYGMIYLMWCNPYKIPPPPERMGVYLIGWTIIYGIVVPMIILEVVRREGFITDFKLSNRKERAIPILTMMLLMLFNYFLMSRQPDCPRVASDIMQGGFISLFIAYMINVANFKISLHALGMGALISLTVFSSIFSIKAVSPILMMVVFAAGLVGTCRLILDEHEPNELAAGYMLGFIGQTLAFML